MIIFTLLLVALLVGIWLMIDTDPCKRITDIEISQPTKDLKVDFTNQCLLKELEEKLQKYDNLLNESAEKIRKLRQEKEQLIDCNKILQNLITKNNKDK